MKWFTSFIIILICRCQMASTFAQSEVYQLDAPFYLTTNNSDCKLYLYDNNLFTMTGIILPTETYPISIAGTWERNWDTLVLTFSYNQNRTFNWYFDIPTTYQFVFHISYNYNITEMFSKKLKWVHQLQNNNADTFLFSPIGDFTFINNEKQYTIALPPLPKIEEK